MLRLRKKVVISFGLSMVMLLLVLTGCGNQETVTKVPEMTLVAYWRPSDQAIQVGDVILPSQGCYDKIWLNITKKSCDFVCCSEI